MTGDDSMSDDVFEIDEEPSDAAFDYLNDTGGGGRGGGLAPSHHGEQLPTTAPSPTGYRDYKPPIEVLNDSYRTASQGSENDRGLRGRTKNTEAIDDGIAHKVSNHSIN